MVKALDKSAVIEITRLLAKSGGKSGEYKAAAEPARRSAGMAQSPTTRRGERPRPQTIMGEVVGPRPEPSVQREKFRAFMTTHRLRPTQWAKDAGVPMGEIMAFLNGRSRGFSADTAEKLARAAKTRVDDMFR
jgi:hypothetical protein